MERLGNLSRNDRRGGDTTDCDDGEISNNTAFSNVGDNFSSTNSCSWKESNNGCDNDRGMCWEKATESQKEIFGNREDFEEYAKFRRMKSREKEHLVSRSKTF